MNGNRPVTAAELDAHLTPMRADIKELVSDQKAFAEFMTGAIVSRSIQERVLRSRHFWVGVAAAMFSGLIAAFALIIQLTTSR